MGDRLRGRGIVPGRAEGQALVTREAISFWGDVDPRSGEVVNPRHELYRQRIAGRILVFPYGRGSSTTSGILLDAIRNGTAPAAIVNLATEPVLAVGPVVSQELYEKTIPIMTLPADAFWSLRTGDRLVVDATAGEILRLPSAAEGGERSAG